MHCKHAVRTFNVNCFDLNIQFEHSIWTFNLNIQFDYSIWTFNLNIQFEHSIWTFNLNIQCEHSMWTCNVNIHSEHSLWTFAPNIHSEHSLRTNHFRICNRPLGYKDSKLNLYSLSLTMKLNANVVLHLFTTVCFCWRCDFSLSLTSIFEYLTLKRG